MSLFKVFTTSASALDAQSVRLNLVASNLANAETVASTPEEAYRARYPVFSQVLSDTLAPTHDEGVTVSAIEQSQAEPVQRYQPHHPLADENGYVYGSNVNPIEEMANMMSASRSYQNNVEVMNTSKELVLRTLALGR